MKKSSVIKTIVKYKAKEAIGTISSQYSKKSLLGIIMLLL